MVNRFLFGAIVILFVGDCVFTADDEADTKEIVTACMNETGATPEMVSDYKPGEEQPQEEVLCFIKCTFEKYGYIRPDGGVCIVTMKKQKFPEGTEEQQEKIYECLKDVPKVSTCKDVLPLEECFVDNE